MEASNLISFPFCRPADESYCIKAPEIAAQGEAIDNLKEDQSRTEKKIDALVDRIDAKFSTLMYWLLGASATIAGATATMLLKK